MSYYVIVFKNTLDAMNAEKKLKENNYKFKIMPTPTSITQSCGICVRTENKEDIDNIISNNLIIYKNIYRKNNDEFIKIK
ncbi:DUF3343 domain-containing protein [Clostridium isatidis]|uniref:Putative Se/S carrier protein-like domain-containing protein n=1 Tax=Clostridium isatidis TaxID=182773 RepID=A0A343JFU7_9CLOT|nr:DUF3343 domain-containing protein [Clostridium isatidis]ASW44405.1 hypothetical protein BEN51_13540 [Clostridium isatidis]NLZ34319.1 DUF3343 domain-containing protein [Clostridiales bacterium]